MKLDPKKTALLPLDFQKGIFGFVPGAEAVVAINNDPDAVIFERANLGLVGDWEPITRALTAAFRRRLSA